MTPVTEDNPPVDTTTSNDDSLDGKPTQSGDVDLAGSASSAPVTTTSSVTSSTSPDYGHAGIKVEEGSREEANTTQGDGPNNLTISMVSSPNGYWNYSRVEPEYESQAGTSYYTAGEYVYPLHELNSVSYNAVTLDYYEPGPSELTQNVPTEVITPSTASTNGYGNTFETITNHLAEANYLLTNNVETIDSGVYDTHTAPPPTTSSNLDTFAEPHAREPETPGSTEEAEPTYLTLGYEHKYR